MFGKLKTLFGKPRPKHLSLPPSEPLEILVPEGRGLAEPPRIAAKTIAFLVAAPQDVNTIEFEAHTIWVHSSNSDLKKFLTFVAEAGQLDDLIGQCRSILYPPNPDGEIGPLGCVQQGWFHRFAIIELSPPPFLKWEIHRTSRVIQSGVGSAPADQ